MLSVKNLWVKIQQIDGTILPILQGIDFDVNEGEVVGLVGGSGAGKTMTALAVMGLLPPGALMEGNISFCGELLTEKNWQKFRGKSIAMIFQEPASALNPTLSIGYQLRETLKEHLRCSNKEANNLANVWLKRVGLDESISRRYPYELSGGMCQRAMIAQAICTGPKLLIADEPTSGLDVTIQAQILHLLYKLKEQFKMALLLISHDLAVVGMLADYIVVLSSGKVVEAQKTHQIFTKPKHPYTKSLLEAAQI